VSIAQLLKFLTVESTHPDLSFEPGTGALIFKKFILDLTSTILPVVGDRETSTVTSFNVRRRDAHDDFGSAGSVSRDRVT
jgi:hypothetical protein